ncbi:hypothetical protein BBAD15_g10078 [Beauveria bassiana D1-5]|uniref:Uncharacterized protein n=1 Tax=Beauveria bassiana D1-5 TaxID=1245745 RepID=A0A0A2VEF5_BEABA|nr:hypothetical protein BBAD15_g10078 [Beauveria bassiana D1-5]
MHSETAFTIPAHLSILAHFCADSLHDETVIAQIRRRDEQAGQDGSTLELYINSAGPRVFLIIFRTPKLPFQRPFMTMIFSQVAKRSPKTPSYSSATALDSRQPKRGDKMLGHFEENTSREQPQSATNNSALQTAVDATEPRHAHASSTDTMKAEVNLQDKPISPDSHVLRGSGRELTFQTPGQPSKLASRAAEGGTSAIKSATLALPCGISNGMKIVGGTTRSAAGDQVYDHAKRATSPAGSASEGSSSTPENEREAAGAQNDVDERATRLIALLSRFAGKCPPHTDEDSEKSDALSDSERSTRSTSPTAPPSEYGDTDEGHDFDAVYHVFAEMSTAFPATTLMVLIDNVVRR